MPTKLTLIQRVFFDLYKSGTVFTCQGQSLIHKDKIFPIAMAKSLDIKPQVTNYNDFMYQWNKY